MIYLNILSVVQIIEHWMISEKRIEKDVEGSSSVII
jgi:hypothetical protein